MNKTLRNILIAAGTVVALVLVLPFLVPLDAAKGRIETAAGHATGRSFQIEGPLRLMFFPHLGVRAHQITLANVPGGRAGVMASVGDIEISVRVLPLLTGRVAVDEIVLDKPVIALEVDAEGNENWKFAKATAKSQSKGSLTLPSGTEFSGLKVHDGRVTYDNARTGTHRAVEHVNFDVAITKVDQPVSVKGDLTLADKKVEFAGRLATLKTFLGNGTTALDLSAQGELMQARFKGLLQQDGASDGVFTLTSPSLRGMAAWLGEPLPGGGLNGLSLQARVQNKEKVTRLDALRVSLDGQKITGTLMIDARGKVPVLDGALAADRLDLNPYLASNGKGPSVPAETGWSRAPISFGLLKTFDGKLSLSTGALRVRGLRLGRTALRIDNQGGVLAVWLDPVSLYGGVGHAQLTVDSRGKVPLFHNTMSFKDIALRPFLADTMGLASIEGTGALTLEVNSSGNSADAIMHGLAGKGSIAGANGRFRGVDLGRVARSIQTVLGGGATGDLATTDFHAMGGSFVIAQGVLSDSDFRLAGPAVQMTGGGRIDIGNRSIDFRLEPRAGVAGLSIGIPFRIRGSWDHVHYAPDLADVIGGVVDNLRNGRAPLKGLFGGDGQKKKSIGESLKDLFGRH